jgi:ferredoxin
MFVVSREACRGCGDCLESCPSGAISLVDGLAAINQEECTACGTCVTSCPQEAIMEVLEPEPVVSSPGLVEQVVAPPSLPLARREPAPFPTPLADRLLATGGAVLAFLGREVAPRLATALVDAVERRSHQGAAAASVSRGRMERRRRRGRGQGR